MSNAETNGGGTPGINYSVKELLAKIEGKLDGVIITIGQKADKHDVRNIDDRVSRLEQEHLKTEADRETAVKVAATLKAKEKADRSWWQQRRSSVAWFLALLVALGQLHQSFPHLHP